MSTEERRKVLQLVADGRINAEEAARLMQSLEESPPQPVEAPDAGSAAGFGSHAAAEFEQVRRRAMIWAGIPLWTGIIITVLSAWGMFSIQQQDGFHFWFYILILPFTLGVLLMVLGAGGAGARWLYINVDRTAAGDWPRHITLALPLPLDWAAWILRNFGDRIEGLNRTAVDEVLQAMALTRGIREPLIVNVDESDGGERVQVYIG